MKFASTTPVHIPMRSPADLRSPFGIFSKSVFGAIGRRVSCVVAFGELSSGSSDASAISDFSISPSLWKAAFSWVFLLCVLSGWLQARPALAQAPVIPCVYDAVIGFSNTQSPASRWQYGYYPPSTTNFIPYGSYNAALYPNIDAWSSSSAMAPAMVLHNRAATTQTYSTVTQPADVLNFHPGPNGEKSVLRWTSPFAGQVALTGRFQGLDSQGGTTDVAIKWSGSSTPLFSSYVGLNGQGQNTPYSVTATVAVGDTLDFVVGYGNGYYGADSTGIAATIVKTVYNPVTDFAGQFNPGGAGRWICGYTSSPSSTTFIPYTSYNAAVIPNVEGWGAASPVGPPMVLHNKTNTAQTSGTITIPPDALNVHPGPNGEKSVVRWMASFAGTVAITGRFLGLDSVGTSTDVSIKWSGSATPLFSSYVGLNNQGYNIPYSVTTSVVAGDTIDFVVGYGNGYYWNDSTGLAANISFTSYPPPLAPPNAPVLSATPGNAQATLSWNPVNGVATYKLYRSTTLASGYSLVVDNLTGTTYTNTGLTNGTTYYYFIKAFSSAGVGGEINPGVGVTPVAPPSAPVLSAAPGNASATLSWNTVSGATGYKLFRSTTSGTYSATPLTTLGGVTSYSDSGLTNGTTYYYVLKATGAGGDSPASTEVSAAPQAAPSAPASLSATPGNAQIVLSWPSVSNATSYQVSRSTQSNNFGTLPTQTVTTTSYSDTGLTNGTTYYYVVRAAGVGGPSLASPQASAMPLAAPAAPTALVATAGNAQVSLSWTAAANATSYKVFRATTAGGYVTTPLATPTGTTYTDTTAVNGTTYFYVVRATGTGGDSPNSNEVSALPVAPPPAPAAPPVYINAYGGVGHVVVYWRQNIPNVTYILKRAATSTGPFSVIASNLTGTTYVDTGLAAGTTFYYRVSASNAGGASADSVVASATVITSDTFNLQATATTGQAVLRWNGTTADNVWIATQAGGPYTIYDSAAWDDYIATPYTVPNLTNGTTYYFIVAAGSVVSNETSVTPLAAPTGLTATGGKNRVDLSWGALAGATSYQIYRSTTSRAYDLTTPLATTTTPSYTDSGLPDDTPRYYVVRAIAPNSNSNFPSEVSARPLVPVTLAVPLASATKTGVSLSWSLNRFPGFASYTIYRAGQTGVTPTNGTLVTTITTQATTTFFDPAPQAASPGNPYYYIVVVNSNAGEGAVSNEGAVTLSTSDLTLRLSASPTDGGASLQWGYGAVTSPAGITGYNLKRATTSGGPYTTLTPPLSATTSTFSDSGLTDGTTYYYRVAPVFAMGEGPASNEAGVTPVRAIPTGNLVLSGAAMNQSTRVWWNASARATQYEVWRQAGTANWTQLATVTPGATPSYTDSGLSNGTVYAYRVRADNEAGNSTDSNVVSLVPNPARSLAPAAPTFGTVTSSSVQVIMPALPFGASSLNLYYGLSYTTITAPVATNLAGSSTFTMSNLSPNQSYSFQVGAVNAFGTTQGPSASQITPNATTNGVPRAPIISSVTYDVVNSPATPPIKGHIVTVYGVYPTGATSETVQWAVGTDASAFGPTPSELPIQASSDTGPNPTQIKPLLGSTTYVLRLKATTTTGTAPNVTTTTTYGPTITVTTLPDPPDAPPAPVVVAGTLVDHSVVVNVPALPARATNLTLYWGTSLATDSNGVPYQNVYDGYTAPSLPVPAGATTVTVSGLTGGQTIQFIWCASNVAGSSCGSITTVTTQGTGFAAPDPPAFLNLTTNSVEIITPVNVTDLSSPKLWLQAKPTGSDDTAYQTLTFDSGYRYPSPPDTYRRLSPTGTSSITAHPEVGPLDLQRRLLLTNLMPGASYTLRFVAYITNNAGTTQTNGAPATIVMPTESLVWSPGSLSCSGIRYPWSGLSASGGQVYHLNAYSAANWDILTHTVSGFSWNQPLSGPCVYAWSADSGAFPEGIKGPNVLWQAPSVSVPTDITLYLQVTPVGAVGRRESGSRNTTPILPTDRPGQFEVTVHVNP